MEPSAVRFSELVRQAASDGRPLRLRGGGSKDFYGRATAGEILDTRPHAGIVAYDPTELVITARCGTPLADVEAELGERRQMLAFEPPHFAAAGSSRATFGGMVAAGLSGPRRAAAGAVRDYVLGIRLLDGLGRQLTFGGQVMKNVAGYDVSRLMTGSLGTLGLILEASVKTLPLPAAQATVRLEMPRAKAMESLNRWASAALCVSASSWSGNELVLRLSGAAAAVRAAREGIGGEALPEDRAAEHWTSVRDHTHAFFAGETPLWRISVPPTEAALDLPGEQLIEWNGGLRWLRSRGEGAVIREAGRRAGGHATLFRGGDRSGEVFQPLGPALERVHRELKKVFDPHGLFNPGRMYAGF